MLIAVAMSVFLLPTFRLAPALAEQPSPTSRVADKNTTGTRIHGSFADGLQLLQKQDVQKVGRDALVKAYERLLRTIRRILIARRPCWRWRRCGKSKIQALGIKPDTKEQIRWLREACESAAEGSDDWFEARFRLAGAMLRAPSLTRRSSHFG